MLSTGMDSLNLSSQDSNAPPVQQPQYSIDPPQPSTDTSQSSNRRLLPRNKIGKRK
jgi:hypothetical protein